MPKKLERKLKRKARKKFGSTTSKRARKYIYGTLRKTGWTPGRRKKRKKKGVKLTENLREEKTEDTEKVYAVKAEVYSRVVGYYRPVHDWNEGKREEFKERRYLRTEE